MNSCNGNLIRHFFCIISILIVFAIDVNAQPPAARRTSPSKVLATPTPISGLKRKPVDIFVTSWCGYCRQLEKLLKEQKIPFRRYDIESNVTAFRLYQKFGGRGVPMTRVGKTVIHGYDPISVITALRHD